MGFSFPTSTGVVCCSPGWKSCSVFVHLGLNSSCPSGTLYPLKRKCPPRKFRVACSSSFSSDLFLVKAARGDPVSRPPVWMMHQAGLYMAIDRKLAERYPSFRERSETTDLIVEISMQPWEAFRPDGVIIFSDILTPLPAFGFPFDIEEIRVPIIQTLIHSEARLKTLHPLYLEKLHFVGESLRLLRWEVNGHNAVLGFVEAP